MYTNQEDYLGCTHDGLGIKLFKSVNAAQKAASNELRAINAVVSMYACIVCVYCMRVLYAFIVYVYCVRVLCVCVVCVYCVCVLYACAVCVYCMHLLCACVVCVHCMRAIVYVCCTRLLCAFIVCVCCMRVLCVFIVCMYCMRVCKGCLSLKDSGRSRGYACFCFYHGDYSYMRSVLYSCLRMHAPVYVSAHHHPGASSRLCACFSFVRSSSVYMHACVGAGKRGEAAYYSVCLILHPRASVDGVCKYRRDRTR